MNASRTAILHSMRPYLQLPTAVKLLCLGSFINRAGAFTFTFLTIYVSEKLGFGITFAGYCFGVFGIGSVISSVVGGQLADNIGRKPIMLLALFGGATMLALLPLVKDRWTFISLVFAFALFAEIYRPAASAMIGDLVGPVQRPYAFSLMYVSFNLGFAVAAPIGGFLAHHYSFQWLFWGDALTCAAYGFIILLFINETLPGKKTSVNADSLRSVSWMYAMRHIKGDTTFLLFASATFLTSLVFMQAFSSLPICMSQLGLSKHEIGWLLSTNGILIVLCQLPVTHVLSRFDRVLMILAGEILLAIGFGLTTFAFAWPMFLITISTWTLGEVVQAAFKQSMVADIAPVNMRARYMGVFSMCHGVGLAIGAPTGSQILERWGGGTLWPVCCCILITSAAVYWMVYLRVRSSEAVAVANI